MLLFLLLAAVDLKIKPGTCVLFLFRALFALVPGLISWLSLWHFKRRRKNKKKFLNGCISIMSYGMCIIYFILFPAVSPLRFKEACGLWGCDNWSKGGRWLWWEFPPAQCYLWPCLIDLMFDLVLVVKGLVECALRQRKDWETEKKSVLCDISNYLYCLHVFPTSIRHLQAEVADYIIKKLLWAAL